MASRGQCTCSSGISWTSLGLAGTIVSADTAWGKSSPRVLTHMDEEELCRSWVRHFPWPRALLALGLLAWLRSHLCNTRGVGVQGLWRDRERAQQATVKHGLELSRDTVAGGRASAQ